MNSRQGFFQDNNPQIKDGPGTFSNTVSVFHRFVTFVSCLLTVTLHLVDVRLTCLINITYLLTYLLTMTTVQ